MFHSRKVLLLGVLCIYAGVVHAGWRKDCAEADSVEKIKALRQKCLGHLAKECSSKTERRWRNRLMILHGLYKTLENVQGTANPLAEKRVEVPSRSADKAALGRESNLLTKRQYDNFRTWVTRKQPLPPREVERFRDDCLKELQNKKMSREESLWASYLDELEAALRTFPRSSQLRSSLPLRSKSQGSSRKEHIPRNLSQSRLPALALSLEESSPYQTKLILINPNKADFLDLHGIISAQLAEQKVLEFIRAAKAKRRKCITIITGRGNHVNHRGRRGVLFQSFPSWVKAHPSIRSFETLKNKGGYKVFLHASLKANKRNLYLTEKNQEDLEAWNYLRHNRYPLEGDSRRKQLRKEVIYQRYKERKRVNEVFIKGAFLQAISAHSAIKQGTKEILMATELREQDDIYPEDEWDYLEE